MLGTLMKEVQMSNFRLVGLALLLIASGSQLLNGMFGGDFIKKARQERAAQRVEAGVDKGVGTKGGSGFGSSLSVSSASGAPMPEGLRGEDEYPDDNGAEVDEHSSAGTLTEPFEGGSAGTLTEPFEGGSDSRPRALAASAQLAAAECRAREAQASEVLLRCYRDDGHTPYNPFDDVVDVVEVPAEAAEAAGRSLSIPRRRVDRAPNVRTVSTGGTDGSAAFRE